MEPIAIKSLDDPGIAAYRCMKDRVLARQGSRIIAEGEHVVQRLLASCLVTDSLLLAERRVTGMMPLIPKEVPVYVVANDLIH